MKRFLKKSEIAARRLLFRLLAPGLSAAETIPSIPCGERLDRVLIMRQDRIGDMIMTLPLLRELRNVHPNLRTAVVASESNGVVLRHEEDVEVITYRKSPGDFMSSLLRVRDFAPDAAVDMHMHDSTTSFIYAMASGARWRLHAEGTRRLPFNVRVDVPGEGHIMDAFTGLLSGLGRDIGLENPDREPRLSREEVEFAEDFWAGCDHLPGDCAAVNISAGGSNRYWETGRYVALCREMASMGLRILLVSSPDDMPRAREIASGVDPAVVPPPTPSILHLAALLRGVMLLFSPDTSVVHLAASMGVPVVGMYLPFDPSLPKWYPWRTRHQVLMASDAASVNSIDPVDAGDAVRRLVAGEMSSGQ